MQLRFDKEKRIHIAIMRKSWGLTDKILTGEKTVESRWYKNRSRPWGEIAGGDIIYFKDSGGPVRARAIVNRVLQFSNLTPKKTREILSKHAHQDLGLEKNISQEIKNYFKNKRYCILVFFSQVQKVKPFNINKAGFGTQTAWLIVDDLASFKLK